MLIMDKLPTLNITASEIGGVGNTNAEVAIPVTTEGLGTSETTLVSLDGVTFPALVVYEENDVAELVIALETGLVYSLIPVTRFSRDDIGDSVSALPAGVI